MKTLEVIYSPICEASAAFIGGLKEWLKNESVKIVATPYHNMSVLQTKLYHANGIMVNGRMVDSCFIDVFFEGKKIDSVPLNKNKIFHILNLKPTQIPQEKNGFEKNDDAEETMTIQQLRTAIQDNTLSWIPITRETIIDEMTMCLCNYPRGNPPTLFHKQCKELKNKVFNEVWTKEKCAGIYAKSNNKVVGLIEVLPREILKKYGFMTGSEGKDDEYLTIGCYEVAYGMPRLEILDELMRRLELIYGAFSRKLLEGIGVFEWPDGFTPYWVYDKYGFRRQETITENKVVMEKQIN